MRLVLLDDDEKEVGSRVVRHYPDELGATEYGIGLKAREIYRDYLYSSGLWENFLRNSETIRPL